MKHVSAKNLVAALALAAGLGLPAMASTVTVGNSSATAGSIVDLCTNCGYVVGQAFSAGYTVSNYSFYAIAQPGSSTISGDITPLLFTGVNNGNGTTTFTVVGVGTSRNNFINGAGTYNFAFGLQGGTAQTTANTYFGFENFNGAVVSFDHTGNSTNGGTFLFGQDLGLNNSFTVENTTYDYNTQNALNDRAYAINATGATPEPSSLALLGTGLAGIGSLVKRRFKRA